LHSETPKQYQSVRSNQYVLGVVQLILKHVSRPFLKQMKGQESRLRLHLLPLENHYSQSAKRVRFRYFYFIPDHKVENAGITYFFEPTACFTSDGCYEF